MQARKREKKKRRRKEGKEERGIKRYGQEVWPEQPRSRQNKRVIKNEGEKRAVRSEPLGHAKIKTGVIIRHMAQMPFSTRNQ